MHAAELTAEFGIAGVLDFVETEHGLVKAAISLDGITGELYLQGAHLTAWQPPGERPVLFPSPNSAFARIGEPEFADAAGDLRDLRVGMRPRVAGVGDQGLERPHDDLVGDLHRSRLALL